MISIYHWRSISSDGCVPQFPGNAQCDIPTNAMDDKSPPPPRSIEITNQQLSQLSQSQLSAEKSIPPPPKNNKRRDPLQQVMQKVHLNLREIEKQAQDKDMDMDDTATNTYETPHHRGSEKRPPVARRPC